MASDGASAHIVVVNDSSEMLQMLRDVLEDGGYRVTTRLLLFESVDELLMLKPDLLMLDYLWSHNAAGWEFLRYVRRDPRTRRLPMILCTSATEEIDLLQKQLDDRDIAVILKPFDIEDFLRIVSEQLASSPLPE